MVAFDRWDPLGRRVTPMLAVYATTTVVMTVAAGTQCAWYRVNGSFGRRTIAARTQDLILDTILAVTSSYTTVPVLLLDCTEQPNPQIGLKWECDPSPFGGSSWVPVAMLGCYRAPPWVCSKEGGEAVCRTYSPWPRGP